VSYCGLVAPLLEPCLREDLRSSRGGVRATRRSSSNTRRRSKTQGFRNSDAHSTFMAFYGRAFLAALFYGFLWTTLSWSTLSFMAFYGWLFLEALFLLWLFMDDSFLKHSFFYGFLSSRHTHPFCGLLWTTLSQALLFFFKWLFGATLCWSTPSFMPFGRIGQQILEISKTLGL